MEGVARLFALIFIGNVRQVSHCYFLASGGVCRSLLNIIDLLSFASRFAPELRRAKAEREGFEPPVRITYT